MELTWPGVPVTAWASMRPSASKTPAERSPASRTEVEKAVRTSVWACSSTTAMRRDHMICMWICARAEFALLITVMCEASARGDGGQYGVAEANPDIACGEKNVRYYGANTPNRLIGGAADRLPACDPLSCGAINSRGRASHVR